MQIFNYLSRFKRRFLKGWHAVRQNIVNVSPSRAIFSFLPAIEHHVLEESVHITPIKVF